MKKALFVFLAAGVLAMAGIVAIDLSGTWLLNWQGLLPGEELPCVYQGTVNVLQAMQGGSATVSLQSGPDACPDEMMADITSISMDGTSISGVLDGGQAFGMVDFQGTLASMQPAQQSVSPRADAVQMGPIVRGSFVVRAGGPFGGSEGSWDAQRIGPLSQIPLLSPIGLIGMVVMLSAAALYLHRRKRGFSPSEPA